MLYFSSNQSLVLEQMILDHLERFDIQKENQSALPPRIFEAIKAKISPRPVVSKLWPRIAAVAAVALVVFGGGLVYVNQKQETPHKVTTHKQEIKPAGNNAFLTLSNGKRITLSNTTNGKIAVQSNVQITKTEDGQLVYEIVERNSASKSPLVYNTIETPNGGRYEIFLPDGTHVWMNAASTLKYPASFASLRERKVSLRGEAYFEVKKDKQHPFIVTTAQQEVKVLGTHFNINAYPEDVKSQTTLLEGSVKVSGENTEILLKPGQMAVNNGQRLLVKQADLENVMAWKNGLFVFDRQQLTEVLKDVSRWYNVEFDYSEEIGRRKLWGTVSKQNSLTDLLDNIVITSGIHYKIEGRRIKLMK